MFFKILKNKILLLSLLALFIIPNTILAYSDYIIAGGENIGIELNSKGVIIVGTYDVSGVNPASKAGLQSGDKIIKVNNTDITNIEDMLALIEKANDNAARSEPSPSCLHFCKISGGLFCFLEHAPDFTGLRRFLRIFR